MGLRTFRKFMIRRSKCQLDGETIKVKRPTAEIFDVVRKICPKEDIGEALQVHQIDFWASYALQAGLRRRMKSLMQAAGRTVLGRTLS